MKPLIPLVCLITMTACAQTKEVPVVVSQKIARAPAECTNQHPPRLRPLPEAKPGDRIEDFAAAVGRTHNANDKQYRHIVSDTAVCSVYINGLAKHFGG